MKTEHAKEMINEIEHIQVVRQSTRETINCCFECLSETDFIALTEAARFIESDAPTIFRLTEEGVLHSLPAAGEVLVCLASLMRFEANRFH